jgi:hypothetical protein
MASAGQLMWLAGLVRLSERLTAQQPDNELSVARTWPHNYTTDRNRAKQAAERFESRVTEHHSGYLNLRDLIERTLLCPEVLPNARQRDLLRHSKSDLAQRNYFNTNELQMRLSGKCPEWVGKRPIIPEVDSWPLTDTPNKDHPTGLPEEMSEAEPIPEHPSYL